MAAYEAKMTVDGKEFKVLSCSYGFRQSTGSDGHPNSSVKISDIGIIVQSKKDDHTFWDWGSDKKMKKDGSVKFFDGDDQPLKTMTFKDGIIVGYHETFGGETMMITMNITCSELNGGTNAVTNDWSSHT